MNAVDEPLESGALELSSLQKAVWKEILFQVFPKERKDEETDIEKLQKEAASAAERLYNGHIAGGQSPEAQLCSMEKKKLLQWSQECAENTLGLRTGFPDHRLLQNTDLSLGREGAAGGLPVDCGKNGQYTVDCRHALVLVPRKWTGRGDNVAILHIKKEGNAGDNPELWLAGVLQWMAEKKSGNNGLKTVLVQLNRGDGNEKKNGTSSAAMKEACEKTPAINAWLVDLLTVMLKERCSDHLPFATVKKLYKNNWDDISVEAVTEDLESDWGAYRCYLEAFKLTEARIPQVDDQELRARAKARFAPLLERWLHE
jgi:hypothetical protein